MKMDIVKRLRSNKVTLVGDMKAGVFIRDTMLEAAAEIERLRAALKTISDGDQMEVDFVMRGEWERLCEYQRSIAAAALGLHQQRGTEK